MSFSADSKYIVAQLGDPDWVLHYYAWAKEKPIATVRSSPSNEHPISQVSINPSDATEFCVTGKGFVTIYRYAEGGLSPLHVKLPPLNYLCHVWTGPNSVVVGSKEGRLFMIEQGHVIQDYSFAVECYISTMQPVKQGFVASGVGGFVALFDVELLPSSFKLREKMALPDPSLVVTSMASTNAEGTLLVEVNTNQIYKIGIASADNLKVSKKKL